MDHHTHHDPLTGTTPSRGPLPSNEERNQKKDKSIPPPLDSHVAHSNLLTITSTTRAPELREEKKKQVSRITNATPETTLIFS